MIVLGIVAIVFPFVATITSTFVFGWIFIFAGIAQIVYAFQSKGAGRVAWKLILGLLYLLAGILVVTNPLQGGGRRDTCKMGHVVKFGKEIGLKPLILGSVWPSKS
ncbi:DUF308 domain-containing protein [Nostoc sp. ChiQUE01b]|uniref:DUF308 domain-containing protein n=1 Tax=Nostoc sp. ChiQUE01b TaxID=3075376 RepID=UPI002AD597A6|nr:DUF308 domain-containing protein [Nostoc sp. ChiQUE01b]MDZ8262173.1 DUF308 domain-containing protein [Nostoc sp. ChiQUE01b]